MRRIEKLNKEIVSHILANQSDYIEKGYKMTIRNNFIRVVYQEEAYRISIIEHATRFFLHLEPYKSSYFRTRYDDAGSFELTLLAIKESALATDK